MKKILSLSLFLMPSVYAADVDVISCNGCTEYGMKMKAESGWFRNQISYAHVFDETNLIYKKYRLNKVYIEDLVPTVEAVEVTPDSSIRSSFISLVEAKKQAINYLNFKVFNEDDLSMSNTSMGFDSTSSTSTECKAKSVSSDSKTAHSYIKSSALRRDLFNRFVTNISSSDPYDYVGVYALKSTQFIGVMANSSNGVVSMVGSVLNVLNPNDLGFNTVDGGRMGGYLDFKNNTFVMTSAYDGDCNDLPLNDKDVNGEYSFTTNSGAESMSGLLQMYGGSFNFGPVAMCVKYVATCTGIRGQNFVCTSTCVKRN
ncbi:hypothetical protein CJF42_04675 [Pseudoalteromonas sp. NBT06-2]|uniref:hypothetical protein n=1 Tax=Pseudoalteromonas sp. NBT06-2 TaxID=2025950 RepID=UPI000BA783D4|nr:hypothetical protein [Pseudoalteromonas sp. NBT06-2]PAJ75615.1 hypothetical protein CJF42_04675 [Pseudoalteromonas sp. NBT06-2]